MDGVDLMPPRIRRAYQDTLASYNAHIWSATTTCARRTLEGIVGELVPDATPNASLAKNLKALSESVDLAQPLITLSHAVREGGNLGAHFDLKTDPDRDVARAVLDLVEYLLEYVYTVPAMVSETNKRLNPPTEETPSVDHNDETDE